MMVMTAVFGFRNVIIPFPISNTPIALSFQAQILR